MNTGVQRVVRGLHRSLSALTPVTPLVWDAGLASYCTLSRRERGFLENPFAGQAAADAEPGRRANPVPLWSKFVRTVAHRRNRIDLNSRLTTGDTLFIPEIFQDNRLAWLGKLSARGATRQVGVCHDALPWRRPDMMPAAQATPRRVGVYYDALNRRRPDIMPPGRQAGFDEYLDALGDFDHIVTISQESAADLRACWREHGRSDDAMPPVSIFHWPVNHDGAVRTVVPPPAIGAGRRSVLCVATFEPRKNHLVLLEAAGIAWARGADFELTLIGRTTAQWGQKVEAALTALQTAGRPVRWLRHVDDTTLRRAYEACEFTVFPSLAEGYGIPIVESLWYGRPCICGVNGAIGEAAAGGGCLAVDQTDPAALASALETLLADQTLYRRLCDEAGRRTFSTWEELARQLLPILAAEDSAPDFTV